MLNKQTTYKLLRLKKKPLGPRHRILGTDKNIFLDLVRKEKGLEVEKFLIERKPLQWRHFIVRIVCTTKEEDIRNIWKKFYKGDLKWGVRNAMRKAEENNLPTKSRRQRQDKNSWISESIRKSYKSFPTFSCSATSHLI